MANMSYCRFHNTALDVQDCLDALDNGLAEYGTLEAFKQSLSNVQEKRALESFLDYCEQVTEIVASLRD